MSQISEILRPWRASSSKKITAIADPSGKCHTDPECVSLDPDNQLDRDNEVDASVPRATRTWSFVIPRWIFLICPCACLGTGFGFNARIKTMTKAASGIEANANHSSRLRRRVILAARLFASAQASVHTMMDRETDEVCRLL